MFYFNSNNLCNGGEMVKKIGLIILMMIACIMPLNANSISVELQDSVDELSKENVEFNVVQVAKLVDGFYVFSLRSILQPAISLVGQSYYGFRLQIM